MITYTDGCVMDVNDCNINIIKHKELNNLNIKKG